MAQVTRGSLYVYVCGMGLARAEKWVWWTLCRAVSQQVLFFSFLFFLHSTADETQGPGYTRQVLNH